MMVKMGTECRAEADKLKEEGYTPPKAAYFMKQTIGNACGTIGVLHALANNLSTVSVGEPAVLHRYTLSRTKSCNASCAPI